VVIERDAYGQGLHRWNDELRDLAEACGFTPRLCRPYRAKTKGKVERFNSYLRHSFHVPLVTRLRQAGLRLDLQTAQVEVLRWLRDVANARIHAHTRLVPAAELDREREALGKLPPAWRGAVAAARPRRQAVDVPKAAHIVVPPQHDLARYDELLREAA